MLQVCHAVQIGGMMQDDHWVLGYMSYLESFPLIYNPWSGDQVKYFYWQSYSKLVM